MEGIMRVFWVLLIVLSFASVPTFSLEDGRKIIEKSTGYCPVSFFDLMLNPEKFDGRKVEVFGYLHVKFEDCTLYALRDYADYIVELNGLLVSFKDDVKIISKKPLKKDRRDPLKELDCMYVELKGKFVNKRFGQFNYLFGAIHVDEVSVAWRYYDGKKKLR